MVKKFTDYIKNSIIELRKVEWPSREQAIKHTILVVGVSLVVAAFLGVIDFILTNVLQLVI
ncbi:preprotein translocase subunit SecE [Patescibacteria group bacterium]|nr:preprotein translocase subunit SecE [Patescibacteria group bacterium]